MAWEPKRSTDHAQRGPARFLEQFQGKRNLLAMGQSYFRQIQDLEDAAWECILNRNLLDGRGVILEALGAIVGRDRQGLDDVDYTRAIRTQIRINRSQGKAADVIAVAELSFPDGTPFRYGEEYPATIVVEILTGPVEWPFQVSFRDLKKTKAGGVRLFLLVPLDPVDECFTLAEWSSAPATVYDTALGLGYSADPDMGGHLIFALAT